MLCYRCGSHNPDGSEWCSQCGTPFLERSALPSRRSPGGQARGDLARAGQVIAGRFELKRFIGAGPNGDVYLARDTAAGSDIAVKIFERSKFPGADDKDRFVKGIRGVRKHIHPNLIVPIEAGVTDEGGVYFTSKFVQGVSLARSIESRSVVGEGFGLREVEPLFAQLKEGLGVIHPRTPHGDLKPSNIIIQPDYLRITDLGLAELMPREIFGASQRREGDIIYFAPEVLAGGEPTALADVFSAGRLLVMMLLGRTPSDPSSTRFYEGDEELDKLLRFVYLRATSEDPAQRFRNIKDFWKSLDGAFSRFAELPFERQTTSRIVKASEAGGGEDRLVLEPKESVVEPKETPSTPPVQLPRNTRWGRRAIVAAVIIVPLLLAALLGVYLHLTTKPAVKVQAPIVEVADTGVAPADIQSAGLPATTGDASVFIQDAAAVGREATDASNKKEASREEKASAGIEPPRTPGEGRPVVVPAAEPSNPGKSGKCPGSMAFINAGAFYMGSKPTDSMRNPDERAWEVRKTGAFCVDLYEYPNVRGQTPMTSVSLSDAKALCRSAGKRLCTEEEWERACKGPSMLKFPYGNDWDPNSCNTEAGMGGGRKVGPAGKFPGCKSGFGVYDMSGNAAEWVVSSGATIDRGGSASKPDWASRCASRAAATPGKRNPFLGFRCCRDVIE